MVDAPASGAGILTGVEVRVFSWAPKINNIPHGLNLAGFLLLPEGGCEAIVAAKPEKISFQHTATRRWLTARQANDFVDGGFNTQPPEGGWFGVFTGGFIHTVSTHSHPKVADPPPV